MQESVIDFPKNGLCPDIWEKVVSIDGMNEIWQLKPEVRAKIQEVYERVVEATKRHFNIIHITGSITSNSYTENADIDMHFLSDQYEVSDTEAELINKELKAAYMKTFIGKHPIEVYFQPNKFQDMMSVGCYDFFKNKWLVGPELTDPSFNPYSEYYKDILLKSEKTAERIRNMIFSIYEIAVVLKKNFYTDFASSLKPILLERLSKIQALYDSLRQMRKVFSSPASKEEALRNRSDRKWKIADASFKLFDKYGYTAIMKQFIEDYKLIQTSDEVLEEAVEDILSTVKKYINNADKLSEKEIYESEQLDEGAIQNVLLAALLAVPGILPAKTVQKTIDMNNANYAQVTNDLRAKAPKYGKYDAVQAANIIARTLFAEARNDGKENGFIPVASVIYNRANGDKSLFADVCLKKKQFSCWNKFTSEEADPNNFKIKIPAAVRNGKVNEKLWKEAMEIAAQMLAGTFKPVTTANMYYNDKTASPSWGNELTKVQRFGSHKFGYLKNHSAFT